MVFQPPSRTYFKISLQCGIYMPGRVVPIEARTYGNGVFLFEQTERSGIYSVRIEAISLRVIPFTMAYDIDGDGILESVEILDVDFSEFVDIENTIGELNVESHEFRINWVLRVSPKMFPPLSESTTIIVPDYGHFDPETGEFEIHRGVFKIEEGPLKDVIIRGSARGCSDINAIWLSIVVAEPNFSCHDTLGGIGGCQKEVWACPGDTVVLCWGTVASNCHNNVVHDQVEIKPGGNIIKLPKNHILLAVPKNYRTNPIEYTATVMDANGTPLATDSVKLHIYEGEWLPFTAQPDRNKMRWSIQISPHTYSENIVATCIQLLGCEDNDLYLQGCLPWKDFVVEHETTFTASNSVKVGMQIHNCKSNSLSSQMSIIGKWSLFSMDDGNMSAPQPINYNDPVCFRLRGACTFEKSESINCDE